MDLLASKRPRWLDGAAALKTMVELLFFWLLCNASSANPRSVGSALGRYDLIRVITACLSTHSMESLQEQWSRLSYCRQQSWQRALTRKRGTEQSSNFSLPCFAWSARSRSSELKVNWLNERILSFTGLDGDAWSKGHCRAHGLALPYTQAWVSFDRHWWSFSASCRSEQKLQNFEMGESVPRSELDTFKVFGKYLDNDSMKASYREVSSDLPGQIKH